MEELTINASTTPNDIDLAKLEDLNDQTTLPKNLIDLLNKQSFNGSQTYDDDSCNTSIGSDHKESSNTSSTSSILSSNPMDNLNIKQDESYDQFDSNTNTKHLENSKIKRTHLINLIFELYDLNNKVTVAETETNTKSTKTPSLLVESFMEKLPPGKNLKNSILLAWKRRYFRLNSIGILYIYDIDDKTGQPKDSPDEIYNLMGEKVEYEQNKIISLDDCRGSYLVFRCCSDAVDSKDLFFKWKQEIDAQIVDRSDSLWVRPNQPLTLNENCKASSCGQKNVLIIDIGTCSIRAGLFENERKIYGF